MIDINSLITSNEGKSLEFKRDLSSIDGILKTIVAFANTAGGVIVIGIDDKTKYLRGVTKPLKEEEKLTSLISGAITPQILPGIEIISFQSTQLICIEIFQSLSRPHYLNKNGFTVGVYVRVGSSNRLADRQTIAEMQRISANKCFDEESMPNLSSEDLDFKLASECFSEYKVLHKKDLENLNLCTTYQGKVVPTIGGFLLFGKKRETHFPDAWIKAGSFSGQDKTKIIDSIDIHRDLILSIQEASNFIDKYLYQEFVIGKIKRKTKTAIPQVAIREALINAVVHADYSQQGTPIKISIFHDRIEIENPGLLRFGLTIEDIKMGISKLRNRVIGRVFAELGLIEQWGSGVQRIISSCKEAGNKDPVFEELGTHFRVTLFSEACMPTSLDKIDELILKDLKQAKSASTQEIATNIQLSTRATRMRLIKLIDLGLIAEIASSKNDPKKKYVVVKK